MNCHQHGMKCIKRRTNGIAEMKITEKLAMTIAADRIITVNK
jgi:hypothetical protein